MRVRPSTALKPTAAAIRAVLPGAALALGFLGSGLAQATEITIPTLDVGAGLRTSFVDSDTKGGAKSDDFTLDSIRLYVNGTVNDQIKLTFNTEYTNGSNSSDPNFNKVNVLDALGRFEFSPKFNLWAGRFLPPSDRANLYGPYYANNISVYTDGVQDGYPATYGGRDNGVAYWGDFDKVKLSVGAFDVPSTTSGATPTSNGRDVVAAGRVQIDFWDKEPGYYLNGTYYGEKDILAVGVAGQMVNNSKKAYTGDFLLEKKVNGGGAFTIESEYAKYDGFGGYDANFAESNGGYGLVAYLFPKKIGIGKIQLLAKYAKADYSRGAALANDYNQETTEGDVNYVIKDFKARVGLFIRDTNYSQSATKADNTAIGVTLQLQI